MNIEKCKYKYYVQITYYLRILSIVYIMNIILLNI